MPRSGGYFLLITMKTLHWQRACLKAKAAYLSKLLQGGQSH
jgi:hypothetical protein